MEGIFSHDKMKKPDFFIVGAPRCGTTSLYTYLRQHPQIFMPEMKEPHFLADDLNYTSLFMKSEDEYLKLFAGAAEGQRAGEASAWYLYSREAAGRIRDFSPDADIVVMLRNPVDMMYSLYNYFTLTGREDAPDFAAALSAEEQRVKGASGAPDTLYPFPVEFLFYRQVTSFARQVRRYYEVFGRDRVMCIKFDDFTSATGDVYREVLEFLGVDSSFRPRDFLSVNPARTRRTKKARSVLTKNRFSKGVLRRLAPYPGKSRLFRLLNEYGRRCYTYHTPPSLDPELRSTLLCEFEPEIQSLGELTGKDLSTWLRQRGGLEWKG